MNPVLSSPPSLSQALSRSLSQALGALRLALAPGRAASPCPVRLALEADAIHTLPRPRGQCIVCLSGSVWITQDWQRQDIVLTPGQRYTVPVAQRLLIQALASARLEIHAA